VIPVAAQPRPDQPDRHREEDDHEGEASSDDDATTRGNAPPEMPDPGSTPELDESLDRIRERAHSDGQEFIRRIVLGTLSGAAAGVAHYGVTELLKNITS
jgi:hypothetical protein